MKKLIVFYLLFFNLFLNLYSEEFEGFLGIPFDSTKEFCINTMKARGWSYKEESPVGDNLIFTNKLYAGKEIEFIMFSFIGDSFNSVCVKFCTPQDSIDVLKAMIQKYEITIDESGFLSNPAHNAIFAIMEESVLVILNGKNYLKSTIDADI